MTPKAKAIELCLKFHYEICNNNGLSENDSTEFSAKQCALISVKEILNLTDDFEYNWWWEVKKEIEKM